MKPLRYAVLGHPIAHSLSPLIHHAFAKAAQINLSYEAIETPLQALESTLLAFCEQGGGGLNITSPLKEAAYKLCTQHMPAALLARAVNTIGFRFGEIWGENTDGYGFSEDLKKRGLSLQHAKVLILGAGGACRGLLAPIIAMQPKKIELVNRTLSKAMALKRASGLIEVFDWDAPLEADVIINTLPSMEQCNLPPNLKVSAHTLGYDLNYLRKGNTPFIDWIISQHGQGINGLGMLIEQAAQSFYLWHQIYPETTALRKALGVTR